MWTIYTLGDLEVFQGILNAVAMVFGQSFMSTTTGIGIGQAAVVGLLISLILVLFSGMIGMSGKGGGFNPVILLVLIVAYAALVGPKVTVQLEDIYTGKVARVDNVPLGVAVPGSVISTITRSVSEKLETAFSTTASGNYIAMNTNGFASPLHLLNALRRPPVQMAPELTTTLKAFMVNCSAEAPNFDIAKLRSSSNPVNYVLANYRDGLTTYYSAATGTDGIGTFCSDAAVRIARDVDLFYSGSGPNTAKTWLNTNSKQRNPQTTDGMFNVGDFENAYNTIVASHWGMATSAQDFMTTAAFANTLNDSYRCGNRKANPAEFDSCTQIQMQAMEQMKTDQAAAGSMFSKMMIPSMNILLALFYAFSPMVMLFAMMSSWHGLQILTKYLLFGIWTQTWLPFATVINYIAQMLVENDLAKFARMHPDGFNLATDIEFYNLLSTKLGVTSDLLAATPVISLAILTGSIFSLTSLAQRWTGKDYADEKVATPNLTTPSSVSQGVASASVDRHAGFNSATRPTMTISSASVGSSALSNAESNVQSLASQSSVALGRAISQGSGFTSTQEASRALVSDFSRSHQEAYGAINKLADSATEGTTVSASQKEAVKAALGGKAALGVGGGNLSSSLGATLSKDYGIEAGLAKQIAQNVTNSNDFTKNWSDTVTSTQRATNSMKDSQAAQAFKRASNDKSYQQSQTALSQATSTLASTKQLVNSFGGNESYEIANLSRMALDQSPEVAASLQSAVDQYGLGDKVNHLAQTSPTLTSIGDHSQRLVAAQVAALQTAAPQALASALAPVFATGATGPGDLKQPAGFDQAAASQVRSTVGAQVRAAAGLTDHVGSIGFGQPPTATGGNVPAAVGTRSEGAALSNVSPAAQSMNGTSGNLDMSKEYDKAAQRPTVENLVDNAAGKIDDLGLSAKVNPGADNAGQTQGNVRFGQGQAQGPEVVTPAQPGLTFVADTTGKS